MVASSAGILYQIDECFINRDIEKLAQYQKHKENRRKELNEFITQNFFHRNEDKSVQSIIDIKTGINEPILYYLSCTINLYYKNFCLSYLCTKDQLFEQCKSEKSFKHSLLCCNYHNVIHSYIENYLINFLDDEKNYELITLICKTHMLNFEKEYYDDLTKQIKTIGINNNNPENYKKEYAIYDMIHGQYLLDAICEYDKFINLYLNDFFDGELNKNTNLDIISIFNKCFDEQFYTYVKLKGSIKNVTVNNFVSFTKFDSDTEKFTFLIDLFYKFKNECENVIYTTYMNIIKDDLKAEANHEIKSSYQTQIDNYKKIVSNSDLIIANQENQLIYMQQIIDINKQQIEKLENKLKVRKKSSRINSALINDLKYDKEIVQRDLTVLQNKYNDLQNSIDEYIEELTKDLYAEQELDTTIEYNIDTTKKYLFVSAKDTEHLNIFKDIEKEFPNAVFKHTNFNIPANSVDIVIFFTSLLDHSTYYDIKNQCTTKNIPYIHYGGRNIIGLKKIISETISED